MKTWLTAIFGAGALATVYSFRTYLGIALVLLVTTCSFKSDLVNYVRERNVQEHQERLAEIQRQETQARLLAQQELAVLQSQQSAAAQARADELKAAESARRDQLRLEKLQQQQSQLQEQQRQNNVAAGRVNDAVQTARAEVIRVQALRADTYNRYRQAQYYNNTALADQLAASIRQYDQYIAQQQQIISRVN